MRYKDLNTDGLYVRSGIISTYSGHYLDTRDPQPESICIEDIAHQLSMQPRYGGKLRQTYSVAQHSIECALIADEGFKFDALMHDASEAYICDLPSPIKSEMLEYKVIEDRIMCAIANKFDFQYPVNSHVKEIDKYMLELEWSTLVKHFRPWRIKVMSQPEAETAFLNLFNALYESNKCIYSDIYTS